MARATSSLLLLLSVMYLAVKSKSATNFIEDSCSVTPYPALCVLTLSFYAAMIQQSPFILAETALSVGLVESQSTKAFMSEVTKFRGLKPREFDAIENCIDDLGDSIDSLSKSVQEMKQMGDAIAKEQEFQSHTSATS
ncbi:hypothetical protein SLEP1_g28088 [Rubroshorea leprosula]|uniref:Pectinesterase inhibitor domain-containing protein n=1 Tax=Rubroshorea leprosula TaxID=152421 RepID=A0AAV5JYK4_9ROSI|nr:hypothetical protein SLEP1_g28088 [Rubroshorea leprosula]